MASIAHDSDRGTGSGGTPARNPISTHPAFPFIVALWFAALLGIGSLVVPVQAIEQLVSVTGLASIIPQTAPPLGFTARALIALTFTVGGGLTGLLIARKVAQAHRTPAPARFSAAAARRPISAHHELGEDGFDGPIAGVAPRGRRALAIAEEGKPSEVFELAPLPGKHLPLSALDLHEAEALELADEDELSLAELAPEPAPNPAQPNSAPMAQPGFTSLADAPANGDFVMQDRQQFAFPATESHQQFFVPAEAEAADPLPADEPYIAAEPEAEPDLTFSPPSLARAFDAPVAAAEYVEPVELFVAVELDEQPEMLELASQADASNVAPAEWQDGELEDLALVQLAQRLGSSIIRRREARAAQEAAAAATAAAAAAAAAVVHPVIAAAPASAPLPAMLAEDFDAAEAAEAAKAMAAYFGASAPVAEEPVAEEPLAEESVAAMAEPEIAPASAQPLGGRQMFQPMAEPAPVAAVNPLAGLAKIDLGEDDDDDDSIAHLTASFSLPLARPVMVEAEAEPEIEIEAEGETFAPVPSPVPAIPANPFQPNPFLQQRAQTFVRIENEPQPDADAVEPAVVFPGENPFTAVAAAAQFASAPQQPRANADENERALREALLNLQRMSSVG